MDFQIKDWVMCNTTACPKPLQIVMYCPDANNYLVAYPLEWQNEGFFYEDSIWKQAKWKKAWPHCPELLNKQQRYSWEGADSLILVVMPTPLELAEQQISKEIWKR
jgi:hypothetical protein